MGYFTDNIKGIACHPRWATELAEKLAPECTIEFLLPITGKRRSGSRGNFGVYRRVTNSIIVWASDDTDSDANRMVVLHELAHAIHHRHGAPGAIVVPAHPGKRVRRLSHPPQFWDICIDLYADHGLLEYAAKEEGYATGQKLAAVALKNVRRYA